MRPTDPVLTADDPKVRAWASKAVRDAKHRAKRRGLPFNLSQQHAVDLWPGVCPVFGFPLIPDQRTGETNFDSPSLDRLDGRLGYTQGNIVIISSKANTIKSCGRSCDLFKTARWLKRMERRTCEQT